MENKEQEEQPIEDVKLDLNKIRVLIPKYGSDKLCEMIVVDRYLGISPETTVMCMEELAARRAAGDTFDFEKYIADSQAKLPPLNFAVPDLRTTLQSMLKVKK